MEPARTAPINRQMASRAASAAVALRVATQTRERVLDACVKTAGMLDSETMDLLKAADASFAEGAHTTATARFSEALVVVEELLSVPTVPSPRRGRTASRFKEEQTAVACYFFKRQRLRTLSCPHFYDIAYEQHVPGGVHHKGCLREGLGGRRPQAVEGEETSMYHD